jgi:hypothetical protein
MIRIYQCDEPCCTIQPHSKRFWYASYNGAVVAQETSRLAALAKAAEYVMENVPQEVTA